ncbi:MAG: hypothetical protein ACXWV3_01800 [Flavisolibacter sp.]
MRSYFQAVLWLLTTAMIIALVYFSNNWFLLLGLLPLFAFVWAWLLLGELRKKAIQIIIDQDSINVCGYYGVGKSKHYRLKEISGYQASTLSSENGKFEYLYLIMDEQTIACISSYHHQNFEEIKVRLQQSVKNLGSASFNISNELRDLFR